MEESRSSIGFSKRKRGVLVKCGGGLGSKYEKSICVCIATYKDIFRPTEWYVLNISNTKDEEKANKEMNRKLLRKIPIPELQGAYLSFHHYQRHPRSERKPLPRLPLITQLNKEPKSASDQHTSTCSAVVGSTIYRFGGGSQMDKVVYFDASRPQQGWKRGPRTLCGREGAAAVTLHGKLYVFGGCNPNNQGIISEFLDTTKLVEKEGKKTKGEWSPLLETCLLIICNFPTSRRSV